MRANSLEIIRSFVRAYFLVGLTAIIFVLILIRDAGLYPHVFADEYSYSKFSRLLPLASSEISNYLYLFIFGVTNICGDGFLGCARILNALFFVFSAPFIYFTARRVSSKTVSTLILISVLIDPINTYTAYFMPEAMYFFCFWVLAWWILGIQTLTSRIKWMVAGVLIALCSLTKPHGMFLLFPVGFYILGLRFEKLMGWRVLFQILLITTLTAIGLKFILGFLLAGKAGLTIFGVTYENTVVDFFKSIFQSWIELSTNQHPNTSAVESEKFAIIESTHADGLVKLISLIAINLYGQLLAAALLLGLPLIIGLTNLLPKRNFKLTPLDILARRYSFFALTTLFSLIITSAVFSGLSVFSYGGEIYRLQARYYNFVFPLFFMVVASSTQTQSLVRNSWYRIIIATSILVLMALAVLIYLHPYQPTVIDTPELYGLFRVKWVFYIFSFGFFSLGIYWIWCQLRASQLYMYYALPIFMVVVSLIANQNLRLKMISDQFDKAGIIAKKLLSKEEISDLVVVGENPIELSRILFYLDNPKVALQKVNLSSAYTLEQLHLSGKSSALVMGGQIVSDQIENQRNLGQFSIVGGHGEIDINFELSHWKPPEISGAYGLHLPPESWGTWSIGQVVRLTLAKSLPKNYVVKLQVRAFGSNVAKKFILKTQGFEKPFSVSSEFEELTIRVNGSEGGNWIEIVVPVPQSPKSQNLGDDDRLLGIALKNIQIEW